MATLKNRLKQVVDWRAALYAGFISGAVFLALTMWLTDQNAGSPWLMPRLLASVLLGADALPPPATYSASIFLAAIAVHVPLSLGFACLIAYVLHRWGLVVGIIGGSIFGFALYAINFYTLTALLPQFTMLKSSAMAVAHIVFGGLAGGIYEMLEVEKFEKVED
jgi:hypothetical protein